MSVASSTCSRRHQLSSPSDNSVSLHDDWSLSKMSDSPDCQLEAELARVEQGGVWFWKSLVLRVCLNIALLLKFLLDCAMVICFMLNNSNWQNLLRSRMQNTTVNNSERQDVACVPALRRTSRLRPVPVLEPLSTNSWSKLLTENKAWSSVKASTPWWCWKGGKTFYRIWTHSCWQSNML